MHPVYWVVVGVAVFVVVCSISVSMYFSWMTNRSLTSSDCRNLGELEGLWVSVLTM